MNLIWLNFMAMIIFCQYLYLIVIFIWSRLRFCLSMLHALEYLLFMNIHDGSLQNLLPGHVLQEMQFRVTMSAREVLKSVLDYYGTNIP